jgi:hypothetical protein
MDARDPPRCASRPLQTPCPDTLAASRLASPASFPAGQSGFQNDRFPVNLDGLLLPIVRQQMGKMVPVLSGRPRNLVKDIPLVFLLRLLITLIMRLKYLSSKRINTKPFSTHKNMN